MPIDCHSHASYAINHLCHVNCVVENWNNRLCIKCGSRYGRPTLINI